MGVPLVGKRHQRKTNTSETAGWRFGEISKRVGSAVSSGRSSVNHQQPIETAEPTANHGQHSLGALLPRGTAFQGDIHTRRICSVRKELDSPTVGQFPPRRNQDRRGGTVATRNRSGRWNQSQDQVRDVGFLFTCRSLGVLWPQSDFFGNTSWIWGEERAKHWRTHQCEASEGPLGLVSRRGHTRPGATGISRPASRVCGRCLRNTSRRTRSTALAGLRLRQHEFQCATFILLASGWAPEEHKNGSVCKAFADASESEAGLAGVEVTKSLQPAERFRLPFRETEGEQTARPGLRVEEEDPTCIQEDRHHRRGLAYFSAHGRVHAGGHGRTPTHDPRLLASQQSACNQQVSSGNDEEQALGAGQTGGCHLAEGYFVGKQVKPNPVGPEELVPFDCLDAGHYRRGPERLLDPNRPRLFLRVLRKPFKRMAGTTGLEPATSAVTGQRSNQLNYVPRLNRNHRNGGRWKV